MNTTNSPHDQDLTQRLARQADQFARRGGTELDISQVLDRAGEIRRGRRMRASMLMAACVLAVAVPVGLVAVSDDDPREITPAPSPGKVDQSPLTMDGLKSGDVPATGYAANGAWHTRSGTVDLPVAGRLVSIAALEGGLLVSTQQEGQDWQAQFVDESGNPRSETWPTTGSFAVSPDRNLGAFMQPDGVPVVVQDGGATATELAKVLGGGSFEAVAVTGDDCRGSDVCRVWVNSKGEQPLSWLVNPAALSETGRPRLHLVSDVVDGQWVAGVTALTDDGSCSEVERFDSEATVWETCDHRLLAFSPDGEHLLASGPYASGMGDGNLAVLDTDTGKVLLDLRTVDQGVITHMIWEDDAHVLATVFQEGRWAVLRIGLDGSREYAVPPVAAVDDVESPFVLPTG